MSLLRLRKTEDEKKNELIIVRGFRREKSEEKMVYGNSQQSALRR
jgi:hypothetical protein